MGSGENGAWTFLDVVTLISFVIGLQNLEMNITQNDIAEQTQDINKAADKLVSNALSDIHAHLQEQDRKLERILHEINQETEPLH